MADALICGGNGFIGGACASAFRTAGWSVLAVGRRNVVPASRNIPGCDYVAGDLVDREFVRHVLALRPFARIIFAAGPADVQCSFKEPVLDFEAQTLPLLHLLDESRKYQNHAGVLLVSSAAVYGNPVDIPVREDSAADPISPYGFHKLHQELLLDQYSSLYGVPTAKARVFSTFGPGLRHLAVWDIVRRAMNAEYHVWGTGEECRDYLYVNDVARALEHVARMSSFEGEVVNIGSGRETSIAALVETIFAELRLESVPVFSGTKLCGSPLRWRAEVSRLLDFGFEPRWTLERGIRETIEWIRRCG